MSSWLAVVLLACHAPDDKPHPKPEPPVSTAETGDTGEPVPLDSDGDGVVDEEDCAPLDATIYPGADERCDGLDTNCDGQPDPSLDRDDDGDGFLWCEDCDDTWSGAYPGADDPQGDQLDTDCDGTDGMGTALPAPFHTGQTGWRTTGLALAASDLDADGCDDLVIGEPGWPLPMPSSASLGIGCWPWSELPSLDSHNSAEYLGYQVDAAPGLALILEAGWEGPRGRSLLFDETFGPDATPLLEVRGSGTRHEVDAVALLGEPARWLLIGEQPSLSEPGQYFLIDLSRRGIVDLETDDPDLTMATNAMNAGVGAEAWDVGDRDGDGEVDLGLLGDIVTRQARFFPQVTGGHVDDAPEVWTDAHPGEVENDDLRGGGDLDGDGRSEALYAALLADGENVRSGRAFLVPWLGAGEFDLDEDAPTRIDGELSLDLTGYDSEVSDLDGDGQDDLVLGAPGSSSYDNIPGKVFVFPGPLAPGVLTRADAARVFVGEQMGDHAGTAVATGDFDGDGQMDLAIGAAFADRDGISDAGNVYVLLNPL